MDRKPSLLSRFGRDESGATAIEYGLIAGLVGMACVGALTQIGASLNGVFETLTAALR